MIRALILTLLLAAPAWAEADGGVVETDAGLVLTEAPAAEQAESDDDDDGDEGEGELPSDPELEAALDAALADAGILYTSDLSDEELARRWVEAPETLGSISVGVT
ncbi:MAG TPA: hypothetical protein VGD87_00625, partial [Archangium sp.]